MKKIIPTLLLIISVNLSNAGISLSNNSNPLKYNFLPKSQCDLAADAIEAYGASHGLTAETAKAVADAARAKCKELSPN